MINPENLKGADIAQFRFAIIAPVIQDTFAEKTKRDYYRRVSEKPLVFPDGSSKLVNYKTMEGWEQKYRKQGYDGLIPGTRSDSGTTRALNDEAISEIYKVINTFPRINATQIYRHLVEESYIPATVSVDTVQRFIKINDLKSARNPNMKDRKAFEEDAFGKMWQADTCHLTYINENGTSRRVYCVMIIDDHSRLLVGGELFYNDNAANFQKVLKDAIKTYGVPKKLYVDNGTPYTNTQLSLICGSLGIILLHTKVRDGASKAKVERHFRTLKETWLYSLNLSKISSLNQFNTMLRDYIRDYNSRYHSGIDSVPFDRYRNTFAEGITPVKSSEWLDECFLNRISRKVRKDATLSIDNESFDAPMQFIGSKVDIRYEPGNYDSAFILYDGHRYSLKRTNKVENCRTKRNNPSIDYSKMGGDSTDV